MSRILRPLLWIGGWALASHAVLACGFLPVDLGHGLCGPWGCAPPLQALAAMHAFWAVTLVPLTAWALPLLSPRNLRVVGAFVVGLGLGVLGIVVVRELVVWLPSVPPEFQRYFPQRLLFVVATTSDVPVVQAMVAGAVCWAVGRRRRRSGEKVLPRASCELSTGLSPGKVNSHEANGCAELRTAGQP